MSLNILRLQCPLSPSEKWGYNFDFMTEPLNTKLRGESKRKIASFQPCLAPGRTADTGPSPPNPPPLHGQKAGRTQPPPVWGMFDLDLASVVVEGLDL